MGVNTTYFIYGFASLKIEYTLIHFSLVYGFRLLLDIGTVILALLSCLKVKNKVVNDAKTVMAIVYINTINTILNFILFLTVAKYYNPQAIVGCLSLILIPTNVLILVFVPKVYNNYIYIHLI